MKSIIKLFFFSFLICSNVDGQQHSNSTYQGIGNEMTEVYYLLFHQFAEGQEKPTEITWLMNDSIVLSQWNTREFDPSMQHQYFQINSNLVTYQGGNFPKVPVRYNMENVTSFCNHVEYEPDSIRKIRYMDCSLAYAYNGQETYKMYINKSFGINFAPFAKISGIPFYFEYFNPETGENYQQYVVRIKKKKVPKSYFNKATEIVDRSGVEIFNSPPNEYLPQFTLKTYSNEHLELIPPFDQFQVLYFCTQEKKENVKYFIKFMNECRLSLVEQTDFSFDFYSICKYADKKTASQFILQAKEWHHAKNYIHAFAKMNFFPFNCLIIAGPNGQILYYREKFVAKFSRRDLFEIVQALKSFND